MTPEELGQAHKEAIMSSSRMNDPERTMETCQRTQKLLFKGFPWITSGTSSYILSFKINNGKNKLQPTD